MRYYLHFIQKAQKFLLAVSIGIMLVLPLIIVFRPELLSETTVLRLYDISHITLFFVMIIRPLADIFINNRYIRPLVILRKGMGVLSASVVVSFILAKIIMGPWIYFGSIFTASYWSLQNYVLFAHLADLSAILLIITSNNFSKRVLGSGWKSIQKLSYVYFYASSLYVFVTYDNGIMLISMLIVTLLTMAAFLMNEKRRQLIIQQ
ncbi:MAG: hypothetical protein RLY57_128 [Candidatus Parcubacteria bacterium]